MSRSRQLQNESSGEQKVRNTWILICMLAIVITMIVLIEMDIHRLVVHLSQLVRPLGLVEAASISTVFGRYRASLDVAFG